MAALPVVPQPAAPVVLEKAMPMPPPKPPADPKELEEDDIVPIASLACILEGHRASLQDYLDGWMLQEERIILSALSEPASRVLAVQTSESPKVAGEHDLMANIEPHSPRKDAMRSHTKPLSDQLRSGLSSEGLEEGPAILESTTSQTEAELNYYVVAGLPGLQQSFSSTTEKCVQPLRKLAVVLADRISLYFNSEPRGRMARFVRSRYFEYVSAAITTGNVAFMGYAADYAAHHPEDPTSLVIENFELGFAAFYVLELLAHLVGETWHYVLCPAWQANLLDMVLAIFAAYDTVASRVGSASTNLAFLRVLRVAKLVKMLRVVRVLRMFRELRLLVSGMLGCMKAMTWSVVLIVVTTYMFGICFLQGAAVNENYHLEAWYDSYHEYWGTVGTAMLTLYMSSTGGESWRLAASPLWDAGFFFYSMFLLYVALFMFVVANTVTSIFLSATLEMAQRDTQQMVDDEMSRMQTYTKELKKLFMEIAGDEDEITKESFYMHMRQPKMLAVLSQMGINVTDIKEFFDVLSSQGEHEVDIDTFIIGCTLIRGPARSIDLYGLIYQHKKSFLRLNKQFHHLKEMLCELHPALALRYGHLLHTAHVRFSPVLEAPQATVVSRPAEKRGHLTL